ncbi:MAG: type IV pilus assembly protein PilM [Candidatus Vogelbacteria bacterium]|nr:type IV pilus assembly protein PilM [Candidatus Vogelbacteria bacterium]
MFSTFLKFFPTPRFLAIPAVGLDISDQSVKLVNISNTNQKLTLNYFAEVDLAPGVIESGVIKKPEILIESLIKLKKDYKFSAVVAALPEELAYIVRLSLPEMSPTEMKQAIELQLDQYVPLPIKDIIFDYELVDTPKAGPGGRDVVVSIFPQKEASVYASVLSEAGLMPLAFEIESQALARACLASGDRDTTLILDIGKTRTGLGVVARGVVALTSTISNIGGRDMTRNIERSLKITTKEAETLKKTKGLSRALDNEEVFTALIPMMSSLKDELTRVIEFWRAEQSESNYYEKPVEKIVICGGQASLPGFVEYLSGQLNLPVFIGDPWNNAKEIVDLVPQLSFEDSLRFSTAIGLALRAAYYKAK